MDDVKRWPDGRAEYRKGGKNVRAGTAPRRYKSKIGMRTTVDI